jgi:hypothetical protein
MTDDVADTYFNTIYTFLFYAFPVHGHYHCHIRWASQKNTTGTLLSVGKGGCQLSTWGTIAIEQLFVSYASIINGSIPLSQPSHSIQQQNEMSTLDLRDIFRANCALL